MVNLNKHLFEQHATPAKVRKKIVQHFAHCEKIDPKDVELPEQPADPIEELGTPLDGFGCTRCSFLTVNINILAHTNLHYDIKEIPGQGLWYMGFGLMHAPLEKRVRVRRRA